MNEKETQKEEPGYITISSKERNGELEIKGSLNFGDKFLISHKSPNCPMCESEKIPKYCPKCGGFLRGVSETLLEEEEGKMPVIDRFWCSNDECDFEMEIEGEERLQEVE